MCPSDLGAAPLATADPKGIEELADMLAGAKNPVIMAGGLGTNGEGCGVLGGDRRIARLSRGRNPAAGAINIPRTHPLHSGFDQSGPGQRCDFSSGGHSAVASGIDYTVTGSEGRDARRKPTEPSFLTTVIKRISAWRRGRVVLGASARGFKETSVQG